MRHVDCLATFYSWLAPVLAKNWKVHSQKPPAHCKDAENAIKYLSHYISGTAISNYRILEDDGKYVTIRVKSYRKKCHETLRMTGEEFVKRFAFHILPLRFKRVRYGGFLGCRFREENLRHCRKLLGVSEKEELQESGDDDASNPSEMTEDGREDADDEPYPLPCPRCGHAKMTSCGRQDAHGTRALLAAREAFWARVYTVVSTLENLPFVYPHDLPRPET